MTGKTPMNTKLTAALACAAALALGACSGGNPPAPADPETEIAHPETPDTETETTVPPEDVRTPAERFDAAHAKAAADLAAARSMVTAAATTSTGIAAARKALTDALAAARALEAPSDDSGRIARAARLAAKAGAAEAEDLPKLRAAASSAGWAGSSALVIGRESLRPLPTIDVVRSRRRNPDGTDAATLLKAADFPAATYEDGKIVMSPGLASSGDLLRMRGIPVAATGLAQSGSNRRFLLFGLLPEPFALDPPGNARNDAPILVAGLRITSSGLVVDMGGKAAPGLDFRLPNLFPSGFFVGHTGANGGYDLKLTFGLPAASPEGNAEHYWTAQLMPWSEHLTVPVLRSRLRA